jgi:hypothetical protein
MVQRDRGSEIPARFPVLDRWRSRVPMRLIQPQWFKKATMRFREVLHHLLLRIGIRTEIREIAMSPPPLNRVLKLLQANLPTIQHGEPIVSMNLERSPASTIRPPNSYFKAEQIYA